MASSGWEVSEEPLSRSCFLPHREILFPEVPGSWELCCGKSLSSRDPGS